MPVSFPPIPRRNFLKASLGVACAALSWRSFGADPEEKLDHDRLALLADTHISGEAKEFVYGTKWPGSPVAPDAHEGVNMADCLTHVVQDILDRVPRPAHVIVNGDCALSSGRIQEYREFVRLIKPLREAGLTVHVTIGNHDNRENLWKEIPDLKVEQVQRHVGVIELPGVNLVLFDSGRGDWGEEQLGWIERRLDQLNDKPAIGFGHYNPYPRPGTRPISGMNGNNGQTLLNLLVKQKKVKAFFFGHTHQWRVEKWVDVPMINQPPVSYYFGQGDPNGWVDMNLTGSGAELELRCINETHRRHGERHHLHWRQS